MVLMIDNYDSFTFNLVQYLGELGAEVKVVRNDEIDLDTAALLKPACVVISPGPCTPNEAGISLGVIERYAGTESTAQSFQSRLPSSRAMFPPEGKVHYSRKGR